MKTKLFSILLFSILFDPFTIYADQVTPSNRVTTHVNVRAQPSTQSDIVGTLAVNGTATFLTGVPYWYEIRLSDSTVGYVSKAWTDLIPDAGGSTSATGKTDLIIMSWNIKWFGYYSQDRHDYPRMAEIIQRCDVVAIQELRGSNYRNRLDNLVNELAKRGYRYAYIESSETGYHNHPERNHPAQPKGNYLERYAFMWDIDRVRLVNPSDPYTFVSQPPINNVTFRQVPIYSDFRVTGGNGFDFRILTIHTVYNASINAVRRSEIQFVHNWIIQQVANLANPEKNIIIIGDFNANPVGQPHHFDDIVTGTTQYRVLLNEPLQRGESSLRTTIQQSDNPGPNYFNLPVYDHALVSNQTSYALPNNPMRRSTNDVGIVEFDQEPHWQSFGGWNAVIRAMSDHRPIWFRMDYEAADND